VYPLVEVPDGLDPTGGADFLARVTASPGSIRLQLLGDFRVKVEARYIENSDWELRRAKNLVKLLALGGQHRMHRGEIMHVLWPSLSQEAAANNLYKAMHVIRRTLEPDLPLRAPSSCVQVRGDFIQLGAIRGVDTDVKEFEQTARLALLNRHAQACRSALSLYAGDLLPEDRYEDWAISRREHLLALRVDVLMCLSRLEAADQNLEEAIDLAQQVVVADPLDEEAHAHLILLFARNGQRHLAVQQHRQLCAMLQEELGIEPEERTRNLFQQIVGGYRPTSAAGGANLHMAVAARDIVVDAPPLFGRDSEIARVEQLLDEYYEGSGGFVFLRGEDGIGKSSLAELVAGRAQRFGISVVWLGGRGAPGNSPMHEGCAASSAPVLLVVDDPDDHQLVFQVIRDFLAGSGDCPVVVLMTLPAESSSPSGDVEKLVDQLAAGAPACAVQLSSLEDTAVELIARKILGARISPGVLDWVRAVAGGKPHYVQEAIHALLGRGGMNCVEGRWTLGDTALVIGRDSLRRPHSRTQQIRPPAVHV
jgi:DNA-binding SARP family transcriptional activator